MLGSRKILVVDDDENIRDLCSEVLRVAGYHVDTARHGLEGLERLRRSSFRYDLVISDMNMPELGGMEFYRAAVEDSPGLKDRFLFVTGDPDGAPGRAEEGALPRLPKPFRISELIGRVERLMEKSLAGILGQAGGKRGEGRLDLSLDCSLRTGSGKFAARTVDVSQHGVKVRHAGADRLEEGSLLEVRLCIGHVVETGKRAVVAWSAASDGFIFSGLRLDEPVPVSSLVNAATRRAGLEAERFRPEKGFPQKHL